MNSPKSAEIRKGEVPLCAVCGNCASHEYTPPLFPGRLLLCNDCNPTQSPLPRPATMEARSDGCRNCHAAWTECVC